MIHWRVEQVSDRARPAHQYERDVGGVATHVRHADSGNRSPFSFDLYVGRAAAL